MAQHLDDKELLFRFRQEATREDAFTSIVKKYQEKLYWHIRRLVITHEDSQLYTWLYRIATNESLSYLDQQKRRSSLSLSDEESYLSNKLTADKHFDANKLEWKLQIAIQKLPEKQRAVFTLRYFDEMPYEEMSRVLETSEGALKASYHHAVKKIEEFFRRD